MNSLSPVTQLEALQKPVPVADKARREGLGCAEREVLRQEKNLRNKGGETTTIYRYSTGPDGKRYITGATVIIRTDAEDDSNALAKNKGTPQDGKNDSETASEQPGKEEPLSPDPAQAAVLAQMAAIEREVIAHEAAHKSVGGQFTGAVSYSYVTGPDGRRYIAGGEVSISAPEGKTPEETIEIMEQVKRAALAPASPSGQDLQVAAAASAAQMKARAEMARQAAEEAYTPGTDPARQGSYSPFSLVA